MKASGKWRERAATILCEAVLYGDLPIAKKYKVSARTIRHWRKSVDTDPQLAAFLLERKRAGLDRWAEKLTPALAAAVAFLQRAAEEGDSKDPAVVNAVANAMNVMADAHLANRLLDAKLAPKGREVGADGEQVGAETAGQA